MGTLSSTEARPIVAGRLASYTGPMLVARP
jgi:hypothetical protein